MLCPLKKNSNTTKDLAESSYYKLDECIVYFGECDTEGCAWWDKSNNCCLIHTRSTKNVDARVQIC